MNNTAKRAYVILAVVAAFFAGLTFLIFFFIRDGADWATNKANRHLYADGSISAAGAVYDSSGTILAQSIDGRRVYNESASVRKSTLHTVGDLNGFIATGVQYTYRNTLTGYDLINGISSIVHYGKGNDIHLTVNAELCRTAYNALNGQNGAVCVYNYQTGKIACMVSAPTYDPKYKPSDINTNEKYKGIYLNRVLSGVYTPGSIFKVVTAACALENIPDIQSRTFNCTGEYATGDGIVKCNGVHGKVTFEEALNHSCNSAFAQIAVMLGSEKLTATAKELGFNVKLDVTGIALPARSALQVKNTTKTDLGWAGIGQYTTLVNPYHMMSVMGCIANGGSTVEPYVVDYVQTPKGFKSYTKYEVSKQISLDPQTAATLRSMLRSNVVNEYGERRFPGLEMCGKTGMAQVDDGASHSWFVGFSQKESTPYAIAVVVEHGGAGIGAAAGIANRVMQTIAG